MLFICLKGIQSWERIKHQSILRIHCFPCEPWSSPSLVSLGFSSLTQIALILFAFFRMFSSYVIIVAWGLFLSWTEMKTIWTSWISHWCDIMHLQHSYPSRASAQGWFRLISVRTAVTGRDVVSKVPGKQARLMWKMPEQQQPMLCLCGCHGAQGRAKPQLSHSFLQSPSTC